MKQSLIKFLAICVSCFLLSTISLAQNNKRVSTVKDSYVISAKAGGVNFISGDVSITRKNGTSGQLNKNDSVEIGDKVTTGTQGRAEILLNPGSFVRIDEKSEFEFVTTDLDDLQVKVNTGSALFEVITSSDFKVVVNTPKSQFFIVNSGIYRVDAMADGTAKLEVWKGKVKIGECNGTLLKGGQATVINSEQVAVAKFNRDDKDDFELWSKKRAKELDKLNAKLQSREMNRALLSSFSRDRWDASNSFGLWVRDPFSQSYCFLPFAWGWSSPYGHSYDRSLWNYQQTTNSIYNNNPNWNPQTNGNGTGQNPSFPSYPQNNGGNGSFRPADSRPEPSSRPIEATPRSDTSPMPTSVKGVDRID